MMNAYACAIAMRARYSLIWLHLICATAAYTQNVTLSGQVTDHQGQAVVGANVFVKGTVYGATTGDDGSFSFATAIRGDTVLTIRHVAMQTETLPVVVQPGMPPLTIRMRYRSALLDEASVDRRNHRSIDHNRSITLTTMDVDTSPGSDGEVTTALRQFPGVQTVGESGALFIRGGDSEESKTLIDGLEITHPYVTGMPDIAQRSRYSPHLFDGITFSTGGYSPAYGGALSAILALDSRTHPSQSSTVIALLPYGLQAGHDQLIGEHTSAGIDLGYSNFGPYYRLINHRTDWEHAPENWTASANFRRTTPNGGTVKWYGYGSAASQAAHLPDVNDNGRSAYFGVANRNAVSLLSWERPVARRGNMYLGYGFNFNHDEYRAASSWGSVLAQHQLRASVHIPFIGATAMDVGAEGYHVRISTPSSGSVFDHRGGAWAELTVPVFGNTILRPGLRIDHGSMVNSTAVSPRFTASYHLSASERLSLAWGKYTQQPDYAYLSTMPPIGYQKAWHYIANYQRSRGGHLLRVEGYYKDYRALLTTGNGLANAGSGMARGAELFYRNQQGDQGLDYWLSYSYLHTRRIYMDYPITAMPAFATPHTLHMVVKQFIRPIGVYTGASYSFATGRPYVNPNSPVFLGDRTAAYHQVNVNAALLRKWRNTFITVVASLNNVLGNRQVFGYRYASDGTFRVPIERPYGRALLIAAFISIGRDRSDEILNQLP